MHRSIVLALTLAVGAVACADRTQDARTPAAEQAAAERDAVAERARLTQPPPPPPAEPVVVATPVVAALVQPDPTPAPPPATPGETAAAPANDLDPATVVRLEEEAREKVAAQAKNKAKWEKLGMQADRKATEEYARDRLNKLTARAAQVQAMTSRVPANRRAQFNSDVAVFATRKADVQNRIGSLSSLGTDQWKASKAALDHALDDLEAATAKVEGNLY